MTKMLKHGAALLLALILVFSAAAPAFAAGTDETVIDYHRCSQLLIDICGQRCVDETDQVIDAFLAGESSVTFDDTYETGDIALIRFLAGIMCPVFGGTTFSAWDSFDDSTRTYTWERLYTAEETADLQQRFESICRGYLDQIEDGDTDLMKYLILYYAFTTDREYNYDLQAEINAAPDSEGQTYISSSLRTMIEGKGQCQTLAGCYAFLCLQAGLNISTVSSCNCDESKIPHCWDVFELDGKYYYCDPTWDLPDGSGLGSLWYFGMTADERAMGDGYTLDESAFLACSTLLTPSDLGLDDTRFSYMHGWAFNHIVSFVPDHEAGTITVTNEDGLTNVIQ